MEKNRESARERNARIRREQQKMSQERSLRSLRSEDFQSGREDPEQIRLRRVVERERVSGSGMRPPQRPHTAAAGVQSPVKKRKPVEAKRKHAERKIRNKDAEKKTSYQSLMHSEVVQNTIKHETDFSLVACIVLLSFIGLVMVTSSSYYYAFHNLNGDSFFFFKKQLFFLLVGMAGMIIAAYVPFMLIKRLAWIFYGVAVLCTILVLIIGKEVNGSTRWIVIGPIQFQPAELAKVAIALFLSVKVEQYQNTITSKRTFLKLLLLLLIPTGCVLTQNLSSAVIIAFIGLVIMFVGGCRFRYFVYLFAVVVVAFFVFIVLPAMIPLESFPKFMQGFLADFMYRSNRVEAYLDPFKYAQGIGYQTVQSLYAIGSGGIFGAGLGESIQKLGFIPEAYNDIIFAVICEELGLFGATIVLLLFGILIKQGIRIAMNAPDRYMSYVAVGFTAQVGIQAIMNVAVNTNTIPATGASLPFISYGGTAMILLLCSMGVLLNISRYTRNIENIGSKPAAAE